MSNQEYCYSYDGEWFHGFSEPVTSEEEALKQAQVILNQSEDHNKLWVGISAPVSVYEVIPDCADNIIELISNHAYDNYGEFAEDYLTDVSSEAENELSREISEVIKKWIVKNKLEPTFYLVTGTREVYKVGDDDNG